MKVLVCGSEGNLMQSVIPKLIYNGYEVFGVDNLSRHGKKAPKRFSQVYEFRNKDLTNANDVDKLFRDIKPNYVIQAAAQIYGVGGFNSYCADILGNDLMLHNNILRASRKYNVERMVYISSSMVYETYTGDEPAKETIVDTLTAPKTEYGLSKFVGEKLTIAFQKQYALPYTIWRPFNIITPYETADWDIGVSHVFADYIERLIIDEDVVLPIIGDGYQIRCFTNIEDVSDAIADFTFADVTRNEIINLGRDEPVTMRELAYEIYSHNKNTKQLKFKTVKRFKNDVKVRIPDVRKAKRLLGWKAKISLEDSIQECVDVALIRKNKCLLV